MDGPKKIVRHEVRTTEADLVPPISPNLEAITSHIEKHLGAPATVFHEIVSELVHVDVHIVTPTTGRNYYTLVTSGMSDRSMNVPAGREAQQFAEVLICFPLYRQEMRFNLRHGMQPLCGRLADYAVSELLDVNRVNVCKKRLGFF